MKTALALMITCLAAAAPLSAQTLSIGASVGIAEGGSDGFEFDFEDSLQEVWIGTEMDAGTSFRLRGGRLETDRGPEVGGIVLSDGEVEYLEALIEYRSSEVFGSSGFYLGPGFYRQEFDDFDESDWGVSAGVNALFPVTRRFGVLVDVGYHWVNFEETYDFVAATAGFRFGF